MLKGLSNAEAPADLGQLRRTAEIETGNAEAAFQRFLTEPRKHRGRVAQAFAIVTYLQRLERHLIALAEQIGTVSPPKEAVTALGRLLEDTHEAVATAIETDRSLSPCPSSDELLTHLRAALSAADEHGHGEEVAFLLGRLVSDTASLHSATTRKGARLNTS